MIGWGWFYLSTVLDDFSRYIVAWKLCTNMTAEDVTATLDAALQTSGLDAAGPADRPRLLCDNGSSYLAAQLAVARRPGHRTLRGEPYHPMTQGKIERWHQTLKNRILLENYFLPGELEVQIAAFVADYNDRRYHESINNLTPADVYFGRAPDILAERERINKVPDVIEIGAVSPGRARRDRKPGSFQPLAQIDDRRLGYVERRSCDLAQHHFTPRELHLGDRGVDAGIARPKGLIRIRPRPRRLAVRASAQCRTREFCPWSPGRAAVP